MNTGTMVLASKSQFAVEELYPIAGIAPETHRILLVITASNPLPDKTYIVGTKELLGLKGFRYTEFDVARQSMGFFRDALGQHQVVHFCGGDTHTLARAMCAEGHAKVLQHYVAQGVICVGVSAGAYLLPPDLELASFGGYGDKAKHGLGLVDFFVKCHYEAKQHEELIRAKRQKHPDQSVFALDDSSGLIVKGGDVQVYTRSYLASDSSRPGWNT